MSGSSAPWRQRRLSVRAATEPLPAPLPPPPRQFPEIDSASGIANANDSTFVTAPQPASTDPVGSESQHAHPERSLLAPRVVIPLALSGILFIALYFHQRPSPTSVDWSSIKAIVLAHTIEPDVPDEDLPYVTVEPLLTTQTMQKLARLKRGDASDSAGPKRVTLNDLRIADSLDSDEPSDPQRR